MVVTVAHFVFQASSLRDAKGWLICLCDELADGGEEKFSLLETLLSVMEEYPLDVSVQEACCDAVATLCTTAANKRSDMLRHSVQYHIYAAMDRFYDNAALLEKACAALWMLSRDCRGVAINLVGSGCAKRLCGVMESFVELSPSHEAASAAVIAMTLAVEDKTRIVADGCNLDRIWSSVEAVVKSPATGSRIDAYIREFGGAGVTALASVMS